MASRRLIVPMLVIARKRHEAVTIDGHIRVEVLCLTPGVARLRFVAPPEVAIHRGVTRPGEPAAVEARNGRLDGSGMGVLDLTLCDQQIITVGDDIYLGLMDVDKTRAVLFVDAPETVCVHVEPAARPRGTDHLSSDTAREHEPVQALLPFATPADSAPAGNGARGTRRSPSQSAGNAGCENERSTPTTIPFPSAEAGEERDE
jgi:sRNA-binding carbon storage regulator CsrA